MSETQTSINGPHETRDVNSFAIGMIGVVLVVTASLVLVGLWLVYRAFVSDALGRRVSLPVQMPGESTVGARIDAIPQPRLDSLVTLQNSLPSYRSSLPIENKSSPDIHAEDLRADRQPLLNDYAWIDKKKGIARIPVDVAMEALIGSGRLAMPIKKGDQP